MKVNFEVKKVSIGMLHPKFYMEMFRIDSDYLQVYMDQAYDHMVFGTKLEKFVLYDLTNHPYTINPEHYYAKFSDLTNSMAQ